MNQDLFDPVDVLRAERADAEIQRLQKITDYEIHEWPIEVLVKKFTDGRDTDEAELFIPDYQREMVWTARQQSRFIESILIRLPVPFIFAADVAEGDRAGQLEIIDGSQRLRTLDNFLSNRLVLEGLTKLSSAIGMRFGDFGKARQMRFKRTTIRVIELTEQADEEARREIFDRLNSGGTKLVSMEVRRGSHDGPFMTFITRCASLPIFQEMVPISARNAKRREAEEMVLRYFAYANNYEGFQKSVDLFLNEYLRIANIKFAANPQLEDEYLKEFEAMLSFVKANSPHGFLRSPRHTSVPRIRFEAIAVGTTLALRERPELVPTDDMVWLGSDEFAHHTRSDASNSRPKLRNRLHYVRDHLLARPIELDPDTELVEQSANADAPNDDGEVAEQGVLL